MQHALPCLFSLLAGCASVAWSTPPAGVPTQWRHYKLFVGEHAMVLARDSEAAREVHERAAAVAATIRDCSGQPPDRGLLIALSAEDPLPVADPAAYGETLRRWQASHGAPSSKSFSLRQKSGAVDVDPAVLMHLMATRVPKDDSTLSLPGELLERGSFVAILPTNSCLDATCSTLFDAAAAAEGVSSLTITLASLVAGHPATLMSKQASKAVDAVLYDAWLSALGVDDATVAMVRTRAGLPSPDRDALPAPSPEDLARYYQELEKNLRRPLGTAKFFVVPRPPDGEQAAVVLGEWVVVVDIGPAFDATLGYIVVKAGKAYERLKISALIPGRAEAEQLAAIHRRHGEAAMLICADVPEQAAALLASHAFFVAGADIAQALAVARHYGASELSLIEQKLVSESRSR